MGSRLANFLYFNPDQPVSWEGQIDDYPESEQTERRRLRDPVIALASLVTRVCTNGAEIMHGLPRSATTCARQILVELTSGEPKP